MTITLGTDLDQLKSLADQGPIRGDVEIFYKRDKHDEWYPYVMHLYRVHEPTSDGETATPADERGPAGT